MKKDIHPKWYKDSMVTCACGNTFTVGSTVPEIKIAVCSKCHPFYTGTQRFLDTERRVDKFVKKMEAAKASQKIKSEKVSEKKKNQQGEKGGPRTLKEMLTEAK